MGEEEKDEKKRNDCVESTQLAFDQPKNSNNNKELAIFGNVIIIVNK